ncbi:MAG TPA: glycosyltransferase [Bryobacteraceae bacterium]|jgi:glycosyltransferase involved in cell wall biosynthesis
MGSSLLFLMLPESPYPPRCGNALRDVQQVKLLQQMGFMVRLLLMQRRSDLKEPELDFVPSGVEVAYASSLAERRESLARLLWRKTGYLLWSRKHAFAWWTVAARPAEFLAAEVARRKPFAVLMRSTFIDSIAALRGSYDGPVIVDSHDADVHLAVEAVRSVPLWRRLGPFANLRAIRRACQAYLPLADEIWAVSAEDAERIRAQAAVKRVVVVPSGVDVPNLGEAGESAGVSAVMVANYGYGPNANGLRWLIEKVWPSVLQALPTACLELVGGNMPAELEKKCRSTPGCTIYGRVENLELFYRRAAVVVAPLWEGGGTRLKIVEAWGHGKAVLTTTKGIEGLSAPENCAVVADSPVLFAHALVMLFQDPAMRLRLGTNGRNFVRDQLSYSSVLEIMESQSLLTAVCQ